MCLLLLLLPLLLHWVRRPLHLEPPPHDLQNLGLGMGVCYSNHRLQKN